MFEVGINFFCCWWWWWQQVHQIKLCTNTAKPNQCRPSTVICLLCHKTLSKIDKFAWTVLGFGSSPSTHLSIHNSSYLVFVAYIHTHTLEWYKRMTIREQQNPRWWWKGKSRLMQNNKQSKPKSVAKATCLRTLNEIKPYTNKGERERD